MRVLDGVDDELDLAVLDHVDDVRPALGDLVDRACTARPALEHRRGAARGDEREAELDQVARDLDRGGLSASRTLRNALARRCGSLHAGGELRLDERLAEGLAHAHHLAGRLHLRAEDGVHARELDEREHASLTE